ncbi:RHS repeat domain-containing protein [Mycoavidus cysteinexigens]|uniref:RHS repeat domain-containing protein n=1 Tax=Mycoavidus cysteinexigens TaxID=1553431 RepID=UPI0024E086AE|nr:RHS repeat domain-containing protein [Mycoavidus cysteinexigens]
MPELHTGTPNISIQDNRGLAVRELAWHRTAVGGTTDIRITRHQYNIHGQLVQSIDPRLYAAKQLDDRVKPNFNWHYDLASSPLRTESVDAGRTISLSDVEGRPLLAVTAMDVIQRWQYEDDMLPGRPLAASELKPGQVMPSITERFLWAGNTQTEKDHNLVGQCVRHYDTAGLNRLDSLSLTGSPLSQSRQLLVDNQEAHWEGSSEDTWQAMLAEKVYLTQSTTDATGAPLIQTDAMGNRQRLAYDVAGQLVGSWLTLADEGEQVIVKSLMYSAAGQKLREEHGNGVVTEYIYEPETHRLTDITTRRPSDHPSGAKVLQDLHYEYDPVGNVISLRNNAEATRFWRNQKVVPENTYTYDTLYQLTRATGREMANIGRQGSQPPTLMAPFPTDNSVYTNYTRTYTYDLGGNLSQIQHSAPATGNNYTTEITVSDRSNRAVLSQPGLTPGEVDVLFDAGGHQKSLQPGQPLVWNSRGELQQVAPVSREEGASDRERYRYGGDGMRVLKISEQQMRSTMRIQRVTYLPGLELRTTHNGTTTPTEDLHVLTVGEAGRAQVRVLHWDSTPPSGISNNQVRYSYDNLIGSSGLELDGRGEILSHEEYYPYGGTAVWAARSQIEASYKAVRYSGKERDATGLYYYGYRYYQPWVGRWLSTDPMGTVDGLNLYRMVLNNPASQFDYGGMFSVAGIVDFAVNGWDFSLPTPAGIASSISSFVVGKVYQKGIRKLTRKLFKKDTSQKGMRQYSRLLKTIALGTAGAMLLGGIAATAGAAIPVVTGIALAGLAMGGGVGFFSNKISNSFASLMSKLPGKTAHKSVATGVAANYVHGGNSQSAGITAAVTLTGDKVSKVVGSTDAARIARANAAGTAAGTDVVLNGGKSGPATKYTAPVSGYIAAIGLEDHIEYSAETGEIAAIAANEGAIVGRKIDKMMDGNLITAAKWAGIDIPKPVEAINNMAMRGLGLQQKAGRAEFMVSTAYGAGQGFLHARTKVTNNFESFRNLTID